jgi:glyoxylase-like metal-dependent hydrolase (beta-lactamase superfamily II)
MIQEKVGTTVMLVETTSSHPEGEGIFTRVVDGIKIHAVISGWIKYRNAHVHTILGPYLVMLDPTWIDWVPIFTWVIEHPEGTIVIYTGETAKASRPDYLKGTGFNGWMNKKLARLDVNEDTDLAARLGVLGISPQNVRWLVLTHLHLDHAGGIGYFPKSEILVAHKELVRPYVAVEQLFPSWFSPMPVGYFDEIGGAFEVGHVLTRAGDVILVPTPGHTVGHQSVIFKTSGPSFFFGGDACFSSAHLESGFIPGVNANRREAGQNLARIRSFARETETIFLPSHDLNAVKQHFKNEATLPMARFA